MSDVTLLEIGHIVKSPGVIGGKPRIAGRRIGVHEIAALHLRHGAALDDLASNYNLSPAQIHAALAYYYDHRDEIDPILARIEALEADHVDNDREAELRSMVEARLAQRGRDMTVTEIATEFGISPQAVRKACEMGWLPARKAGGTWLIRREDAEARW
jgi:uncharacterized protein (DUF433 family)